MAFEGERDAHQTVRLAFRIRRGAGPDLGHIASPGQFRADAGRRTVIFQLGLGVALQPGRPFLGILRTVKHREDGLWRRVYGDAPLVMHIAGQKLTDRT